MELTFRETPAGIGDGMAINIEAMAVAPHDARRISEKAAPAA
jgi:hypothetical protein